MGEELLIRPLSLTEQFNIALPHYLAIGMTCDQFWNDDPMLVKYYRKADEIRRHRENHLLHLQGAYFYDALMCVSPILHAFAKKGTKAIPYLVEPYPLTAKEGEEREEAKEQREMAKMKTQFEAIAMRINQKFKKPTRQE